MGTSRSWQFVQFRSTFRSLEHGKSFDSERPVSFWKFRVDLPCGLRDMSSPLHADRGAKKSRWLKFTEISFGNEDARYGEHNELYCSRCD